jgi:predicted acetyltransferase
MKIRLVKPAKSHETEVCAYVAEFLDDASTKHIPGAGGVEHAGSYNEWIDTRKELEHGKNMPTGIVPATQYVALDDNDEVVGFIQLRHTLNDYLMQYGGHIGYSIRPTQRRKGYASRMLSLCLDEARKLNINKILITCDDDNIASEKVIVANGGIFENIVKEKGQKPTKRFWIKLNP